MLKKRRNFLFFKTLEFKSLNWQSEVAAQLYHGSIILRNKYKFF